MLFMGCDMGTKNFAVTIIKAKVVDGKFRFKVIGTKTMTSMIHDVKIAQQECKPFLAEFDNLPEVDLIAAERYQPRPGRGGNTTTESIAMMLGAMVATLPVPVTLYTAATWKNAFNRTAADLKEMYEDIKKQDAFVIHQLDSFLIALYHAAKHYGVQPYDFISSYKDEARLTEMLMNAQKL